MKEGYPITALNSIRTNHTFRTLLIVAMLFGWLGLSQRCALGQMLKTAQTAAVQHECCKRDSQQPLKAPTDGSRGAECCQALSVLVPDGAKLPLTPLTESVCLAFEGIFAALQPRSVESTAVFDTGPPPDVPAFAELVLHRSLRSLAPPLLS